MGGGTGAAGAGGSGCEAEGSAGGVVISEVEASLRTGAGVGGSSGMVGTSGAGVSLGETDSSGVPGKSDAFGYVGVVFSSAIGFSFAMLYSGLVNYWGGR